MIGSISFGISLEKGRSRVPIPPAVINAGYDSRLAGSSASTELVALRFDNMCRPHTPLFFWPCQQGVGLRQRHVFNMDRKRNSRCAVSISEYAGTLHDFLAPAADGNDAARRVSAKS